MCLTPAFSFQRAHLRDSTIFFAYYVFFFKQIEPFVTVIALSYSTATFKITEPLRP